MESARSVNWVDRVRGRAKGEDLESFLIFFDDCFHYFVYFHIHVTARVI